MKLLFLLLALFCAPVFVVAQSKLSGEILNSSGRPFEICKITLTRDSTYNRTIEADSSGRFVFNNLQNANYALTIKIPSQTVDTSILVSGNTVFNFITESTNDLDEFVVIAKQPTLIQKVDRTIFNPANIPFLVGGNASDVIEFAPGVFIKGDNIQLSNGTSARVMLNDKLIPLTGSQLISFIRSISTEDIQYIEIIPVAPVKYAASSGGLINIRLIVGAKSKLSKGSITADIGQKFYSQQALTANYAYRKNKFSLYSSASANNSKYRYVGKKNIDTDTAYHWREDYKTISDYSGLNLGLGLNYEINRKTEIGLLYFSNIYEYGTENISQIDNLNNQNILQSFIGNKTNDVSRNMKNAVNLNLITHLDTLGKKLEVNFDYTNFENRNQIDYSTMLTNTANDSSYTAQNRLSAQANLFSGGVDYTHPVRNVNLNFGGRYSYASNNYNLSVYNDVLEQNQEDTLKSNAFDYEEHIQAIYSSVEWKIKKWSFQIGLRGENTVYQGKSPTTGFYFSNSYFQITPKMFAMYENKKGQFWNLSYSRDFFRPNYTELNPFRYYTSTYQFRTGNPYLKPGIYHSISVGSNFRDLRFSLSIDYSLKGTSSVTIFDPNTQVQQTTVANLFSSKSIGLFTNYSKTFGKRLSIDIGLMTYLSNSKVDAVISPQNLTAFTISSNFDVRYSLDRNQTFTLSLSSWYTSPYFQQITRQVEYPYTNISLTKNLLRNRLNLKLAFGDPFRIMGIRSTTMTNQTKVTDRNYFDTQGLFLSVAFRFGNDKMNVNQRSTNTTGEGSRLGK